jgi:two-component system NarL family response regulator
MDPEAHKIRVMIADDHPVVRLGLKTLVTEAPDMSVVAESARADAVVETYQRVRPDVVLLDLRMPPGDGIDVLKALRAAQPEARVIIVTSYKVDEDIYRAVQHGARGFLLKDEGEVVLLEAIRSVHAGDRFLPPAIAARLAERMEVTSLSPREVEVLELVARGLSNKEIANTLMVSEGTIKTHLKRTYEKLGVDDRTDAAFQAAERGLIRR